MTDAELRNSRESKVNEFFYAFHVATRKFTLGTVSSILYNAITLLGDQRKKAIFGEIYDGLLAGKSLRDACQEVAYYPDPVQHIIFACFHMLDTPSSTQQSRWEDIAEGIRYQEAWPQEEEETHAEDI